jgi:hypothetical protein
LLAQATIAQADTTWIIIAVVVMDVVVMDGVAIATIATREHLQRLRFPFGPQYDRAVERMTSVGKAEAEYVYQLPRGARARYAGRWRAVQAEFVDQPDAATAEAGRLVLSLMLDRGYPIEVLEHPVADASGEHGNYVEHNRIANEISLKNYRGEASTEELRQAIMHYRAVFDGLLSSDASSTGARIDHEARGPHRDADTVNFENATPNAPDSRCARAPTPSVSGHRRRRRRVGRPASPPRH